MDTPDPKVPEIGPDPFAEVKTLISELHVAADALFNDLDFGEDDKFLAQVEFYKAIRIAWAYIDQNQILWVPDILFYLRQMKRLLEENKEYLEQKRKGGFQA